MILSKSDIVNAIDAGEITILNAHAQIFQAAGIQLSLGHVLRAPRAGQIIDPRTRHVPVEDEIVLDGAGFRLEPNGFVLGHTAELIALGTQICGRIDGRSTMARIGLTPHQAAMTIWPGHGLGPEGPRPITLELKNHGPNPILLFEGLIVANMTFESLHSAAPAYDQLPEARYGKDRGRMTPNFQTEIVSAPNRVANATSLCKS